MSKIKVNISGINGLVTNLKSIKSKNFECSADLSRVKFNLDWQIKAKSNISDRITNLKKRVDAQGDILNILSTALNAATDNYGDKDYQLGKEVKNIVYTLNSFKYTVKTVNSSLSSSAAYQKGNVDNVNSIFSSNNAQNVNLSMLK